MSEYRDILDDVVREDAAEQQDTDFEEEEVREQVRSRMTVPIRIRDMTMEEA